MVMTTEEHAARWQDYAIYIPFYVGAYRWALFMMFKMIPALFYKEITRESLERDRKRGVKLEPVTNKDLTVVVAVYEPPEEFPDTIRSIVANDPGEVLIVADITSVKEVREICKDYDPNLVRIVPEAKPGKRIALVTGIKESKTKFTCLVDDDIEWCSTLVEHMMLPFEYPDMGGVGVRQNAYIRHRFCMNDILNSMRLGVRYIEIKATSVVDQGCPCISGRTACYRTSIMQTEEMYDAFLHEKFLGMQVLSGDDKFLTRWIINHGYKTWHQLEHNCELSTKFLSGKSLLLQFIRWSRNTWRSDFNCLFVERIIWKKHLFTALILFDKFFVCFFMLYGITQVIVFFFLYGFDYPMLFAYIIWLCISRSLKLYYYLWERPLHIIFVPCFIIFQYIQVLIRLYALCTLHIRGWGTRTVDVEGDTIVRSLEGLDFDPEDLPEDMRAASAPPNLETIAEGSTSEVEGEIEIPQLQRAHTAVEITESKGKGLATSSADEPGPSRVPSAVRETEEGKGSGDESKRRKLFGWFRRG